MPSNNEPEIVVRDLFQAFRRGDLEGPLATLHEDVSLTYAGANPTPGKAVLIGREKARRFFGRICRRLEMSSFEAHEALVSDHTVVA